MPEIYVNLQSLHTLSSQLQQIMDNLSHIERDVQSTMHALSWDVPEKGMIVNQVNMTCSNAVHVVQKNHQIKQFVIKAANEFEHTDKGLSGELDKTVSVLDRFTKLISSIVSRIFSGISGAGIHLFNGLQTLERIITGIPFWGGLTALPFFKEFIAPNSVAVGPVWKPKPPSADWVIPRSNRVPSTPRPASPPVSPTPSTSPKPSSKPAPPVSPNKQGTGKVDKFLSVIEQEAKKGFKENVRKGAKEGDNITPYGKWAGINGQPWCAAFVSWCAKEAGILNTTVPMFTECTAGKNWYAQRDRFQTRVSGYIPAPGDVIFFSNNNGRTDYHTGIVTGYDPKTQTVYTVEGNSSDSVARRSYKLNTPKIHGYGVNGGGGTGQVPQHSTSGVNQRTQ
ncbi:MAG: CHAP domain-containing protein [Clostridia bacterium]|nr:CHAP domain-containing protein [Clostridia bacterium]